MDTPSILLVGESFSLCAMLGGLWFELVKTAPTGTSGELDFDEEKVVDKWSVQLESRPYHDVMRELIGK